MEFLQENMGIVVLLSTVVLIAVLVIVGVVLGLIIKLNKNTIVDTLKIDARVVYENIEGEKDQKFNETLSISIFNNNWRDIVVSDFGFRYKGLYLTFADEYLKTNNIGTMRIIVPARKYIVLKIEPERLENFIIEHNFEAVGIDEIYNVVVDNVGTFITKRNHNLTKIMVRRQKARIEIAKSVLHERFLQQYMKEHDNQIPLKEHFYNFFHSKKKKNLHLVKQANMFVNSKLKVDSNNNILKQTNKGTQKLIDIDVPKDDRTILSEDVITKSLGSDVRVTIFDQQNKKDESQVIMKNSKQKKKQNKF